LVVSITGLHHSNVSIKRIEQIINRICDVMVRMLASSAVDHGFEPQLGKTKDFKIGMCCFSAKDAALRRKSKDWLA